MPTPSTTGESNRSKPPNWLKSLWIALVAIGTTLAAIAAGSANSLKTLDSLGFDTKIASRWGNLSDVWVIAGYSLIALMFASLIAFFVFSIQNWLNELEQPNRNRRSIEEGGWRARDQIGSRRNSPHYEWMMDRMVLLLGFSATQFQKRLKEVGLDLPLEVVLYFMQNPGTIPRPDILGGMCEALYLHKNFHRTGKLYEYKAVLIARIEAYHDLGIGTIIAYADLHEMKMKQMQWALKIFERERARQLRFTMENYQ